ncbi:MAG: hypothetical protein CMH58_03075 [Myxococcales bacterium]|nr:hypothetical protein [Myxococcales bacterium]
MLRGALLMPTPKSKGGKKNAAYFRALQWRLVACYGGFEILIKSLRGKISDNGLRGEDFLSVINACGFKKESSFAEPSNPKGVQKWVSTLQSKERGEDFLSVINACGFKKESSFAEPSNPKGVQKWVSTLQSKDSNIEDFLLLNKYDLEVLSGWLTGNQLTSRKVACLLAKAIRNATAHGFLSPTKAKEFGMEQILQDLPKNFREIHEALIIKLYSNFTKQGK